ncbi:hypothetical protein N5K21_26475 [Rhizobium pusense]|uniref:DUF4376 domain-containing protein n=1 Tax=Agrobacterium pusense TaxID=648995 RepID=UPI00244D6D19|nr:hypothetical protein [Agrobacterium pusense]MDH2092268.1 hypothetical protein [Agrobacterium pusense]
MANNEYARIENGSVVERLSLDETVDLETTFSAEFLASLETCAKSVQVGWVFDGESFSAPPVETPSIDAVKAAQIETLRRACEESIIGGFKSSALGAEHSYPSDIKAQINLMVSVTDSLMPNLTADWSTPFWVCDAQGNWTWEAHTASQIQQAGRDGKAAVVAAQTKLGELTAAVEAAKTKKAVEAIIW